MWTRAQAGTGWLGGGRPGGRAAGRAGGRAGLPAEPAEPVLADTIEAFQPCAKGKMLAYPEERGALKDHPNLESSSDRWLAYVSCVQILV